MGKRLPEELEAPDLKLARLAKERRAMEARGKVIDESEVAQPEPVRFFDSVVKDEVKEAVKEAVQEEKKEKVKPKEIKKDKKNILAFKKRRK